MDFVITSRLTGRIQRPHSEWKVLQPQTTKLAFKYDNSKESEPLITSVQKEGDSHPSQMLHSNTGQSPSVLVKLQPNETIIICREANYTWNGMV